MTEILERIQQVAAIVGILGLVGTSAAAVAYWLFRQFAQGWIKAQFDKELAAFKAGKDRELEQFKAEATRLLDKAAHFHRHEFEVLPRAHALLIEAYSAVHDLIARVIQHPDLDRMDEEEFSEFIEASDLVSSQKSKLRRAQIGHRNSRYLALRPWQMLGRAKSAQANFQNYVVLNEMFMTKGMAAKFQEAAKFLLAATISEEIREGYGGPELRQAARDEFASAGQLVAQLREEVRDRLKSIEFSADL